MAELANDLYKRIDEYIVFRKEMGYSNNHQKHLTAFKSYCASNFPDEDKLTRDLVRGWFNDEVAKGRACFENKAMAIRALARYIGGDAYILPMDCVPKAAPYTPYIPTVCEFKTFLKAVDEYHNKHDPFISVTMGVLLRLLYCCGLRPGEGRRIQVKDIDFLTGEILIEKTKRNKDRLIVVSDDVIIMLKEYRQKRSIYSKDDTYFFIHSNGSMIKESDLNGFVRKCWRLANPDTDSALLPKLRPYDLRHLFASTVLQNWLDEGKDLYAMLPYLRSYMGHERFEDTAYYIHILPERLLASKGVNWDHIDSVNLEVKIWDH